jgi:hypothetical protein
MLHTFFCLPSYGQDPDAGFDRELDALGVLDLPASLISVEEVAEGLLDAALAHIEPARRTTPALYRGYMLSPDAYEALYDALADLNFVLVTAPGDYSQAHLLPESFHAIAPFASPTVFIDGADPDEAWEAACTLGRVPRMLKDHVKSAKFDWFGACHVPPDCTRERFDQILAGLVEERGEDFTGGVTVRALAALREVGRLPGGAPAHEEYRALVVSGELVAFEPIWVDLTPQPAPAPRDLIREVASRLDAPFFSLDLARTVDGEWVAIEVGDGGVSRLSDALDLVEFYGELASRLT